jgi:large subunit ribosomal protein L23
MRDPRKVIVKPILSEKSNISVEKENKYTFKIARDATKKDVKDSVEAIFKVHVINVHTANFMGKPKRRGRMEGRKPSWKKAVVKLAHGESIEIFKGL